MGHMLSPGAHAETRRETRQSGTIVRKDHSPCSRNEVPPWPLTPSTISTAVARASGLTIPTPAGAITIGNEPSRNAVAGVVCLNNSFLGHCLYLLRRGS